MSERVTSGAWRPLVSVVMSSFEHEAFIGAAIESVLAQSYQPVELVIVDDASHDETARVAAHYAQRFPGIVRLERKRVRRGPCRRRNDALGLARGELIAWLDSDDEWLPQKLERQVGQFAEPRVAFAYTDWRDVDGAGRPLPPLGPHRLQSGNILAALFEEGCFICSSSAVFRRSALEARGVRFRDSEFSFGDDYFLWLALSLDFDAVAIDEPLVLYRRHGGNESMRLRDENFHLRRITLLREFVQQFPDAEARLKRRARIGLSRHYLKAAVFEARRGRRGRALRCFGRALRYDAAAPLKGVARTGAHAAWRARRRQR